MGFEFRSRSAVERERVGERDLKKIVTKCVGNVRTKREREERRERVRRSQSHHRYVIEY